MIPKKIAIILYFLVASIYHSGAQETVTSGRLSISITNLGDGVAISSIKDNGAEILNTSAGSDLFTLFITNTTTGTDEIVTATTGWSNVSITNNGDTAVIELTNPTNANLPITLLARINIDTNDANSSWDLSISGLGANASLIDVIFPQLNIEASGNDTFLYPLYSGRLTENPGSGIDYYNDTADTSDNGVGIYPRGWGTTMPFFSYYNSNYGIYFGFHDPDASLKEFGVKGESGGVKIQCKTPIPNKTISNNNWEFPGVFELDLYNGDWYDAALIYKDWVSQSANYFPQETPERAMRQHVIGDIGVWLTTSDFSTESMADMENYIQTAINFFDVPVGMHIYNWNYAEHDHFYPVYFPERTGLSNLIASIQDNNDAVIMPYINGRLWDTGQGGNDAGDADAATYYADNGLADATKDENGSVFTQVFESNVFATMCPTQTDWQNILIDASDQVTNLNRLNAKSVYIDMVAASAPTQCMDPNHNHDLGGGSFWRAGYKQMFENIHNSIPSDAFITVEGGNDFLADEVDGFMVQGWQTDHQVPAWQAIYTGKVQLFGTQTGGSHYPYQKFYGRLAQGFAYGVQTGRQYMWLAINPSANADKFMAANFVKSLSQMRYKLRDFMSYGSMKRPIVPHALPTGSNIPTITYDVYDWGGHHGLTSVTNSAIQGSVWQNDNEVVVVFVNGRIQSPAGTVGGNIRFEYDFDPSDYGLTGNLTIQEISPTADGTVMPVDVNTFPKEVNLQNLELVAYKIIGESSLALEDVSKLNFSIYPNPANKSFTIQVDSDTFFAKVYNNLGQVVIDTIETPLVDVSYLTAGLYVVEIEVDGVLYRKKLLVE